MSTQFVVQLQNRPGALAAFARALAERGIDIHEIAGGGAGDHGYAVVSTDDDAATRAVLRSFGYPFVEGEALVVEIDDRAGRLRGGRREARRGRGGHPRRTVRRTARRHRRDGVHRRRRGPRPAGARPGLRPAASGSTARAAAGGGPSRAATRPREFERAVTLIAKKGKIDADRTGRPGPDGRLHGAALAARGSRCRRLCPSRRHGERVARRPGDHGRGHVAAGPRRPAGRAARAVADGAGRGRGRDPRRAGATAVSAAT